VNIQIWVVPNNAHFSLGIIEIGTLISKHSIILQSNKPVCKAFRNIKLCKIIFAKLNAKMLPISGRIFPDIYHNIQSTPTQHPYKFALGKRRFLEMQPSESMFQGRTLVFLNKFHGKPMFVPQSLIVGFGEV